MGTGLTLAARRRDGSEIPIEISLSPIRADGHQLYAAAIRDVTDRVEMECERRDHVNPEVVRVDELLDGFAELMRRTLGDEIEVEVRSGQRGLQVLADRTRLEQVLLNLSLNARDAMPDGGVTMSVLLPAATGSTDEMDGADRPPLARELTRRAPYTRVLFMSGYAEPLAKLDDNASMLPKPFTEDELLDAVAAAISN